MVGRRRVLQDPFPEGVKLRVWAWSWGGSGWRHESSVFESRRGDREDGCRNPDTETRFVSPVPLGPFCLVGFAPHAAGVGRAVFAPYDYWSNSKAIAHGGRLPSRERISGP